MAPSHSVRNAPRATSNGDRPAVTTRGEPSDRGDRAIEAMRERRGFLALIASWHSSGELTRNGPKPHSARFLRDRGERSGLVGDDCAGRDSRDDIACFSLGKFAGTTSHTKFTRRSADRSASARRVVGSASRCPFRDQSTVSTCEIAVSSVNPVQKVPTRKIPCARPRSSPLVHS